MCQKCQNYHNLWHSNSTSEKGFCDNHPCQNKGADCNAPSVMQLSQSGGECALRAPLGRSLAGAENTQDSWHQGSSRSLALQRPTGNLEAHALLPSSASQVTAPSQGGKLSPPSSNLAPRGFLFFFCGLRDLSSPTRNWTQAMVVKVSSPNHWTTREFSLSSIFI